MFRKVLLIVVYTRHLQYVAIKLKLFIDAQLLRNSSYLHQNKGHEHVFGNILKG